MVVAACVSACGMLLAADVEWPTYNGDYSGRRFSELTQINKDNVKSLSLSWVYRLNGGADPSAAVIKATPIVKDGVMYFTAPDHAWAIDARTGHEIWKYQWASKGGIHLGNRGAGIYENWLYFETPDCHLISLNRKDGSFRWSQSICNLDQMYYSSVAPIIIKNHVIVGVSGDDIFGLCTMPFINVSISRTYITSSDISFTDISDDNIINGRKGVCQGD